jgi:hypothetical protein
MDDNKKYALIYWGVIFLLFGVPLIAYYAFNKPSPEEKRKQEVSSIIDKCYKQTNYGIFYDNGYSNLPVCRLPITDSEKACDDRCKGYRQQLENGDIKEPSLDENCTGRICQ